LEGPILLQILPQAGSLGRKPSPVTITLAAGAAACGQTASLEVFRFLSDELELVLVLFEALVDIGAELGTHVVGVAVVGRGCAEVWAQLSEPIDEHAGGLEVVGQSLESSVEVG
jgi:hypothetical protein